MNNTWIPTKEKNPEYSGFFLVTRTGAFRPTILFYSNVVGAWLNDSNKRYHVLAWMPLPEIYTE